MNCVKNGIRILGERNFKNSALNKEDWMKLLQKARRDEGCRANDAVKGGW